MARQLTDNEKIIVVIWMILGAIAFVMSFNCIHDRYSGNTSQKIVMFILALIMGPLWFLFYWYENKHENYCN